ncbi:MAG: hypothetical protein CM15mV126_500 [uncultured marine virus]|nr:MAG: hypothetical protein CM15mV126_500 [uncultured marine virus]
MTLQAELLFIQLLGGSASLSERLRLTSGGDFLVGTTAFAAGQTSSNITPSQIFLPVKLQGLLGICLFKTLRRRR